MTCVRNNITFWTCVCVTRQRLRIVIKTRRRRTCGVYVCVCVCLRRGRWSHLGKGLPTPVTCRGGGGSRRAHRYYRTASTIARVRINFFGRIYYILFYTLRESVCGRVHTARIASGACLENVFRGKNNIYNSVLHFVLFVYGVYYTVYSNYFYISSGARNYTYWFYDDVCYYHSVNSFLVR